MSDTTGASQFSANEALDKAKEMAADHPDVAKTAIDKVEQVLNEQTGGKFQDLIEKGGDLLGKQLGLPQDAAAPAPTPAEAPSAEAPSPSLPAPVDAPAEAPSPSPADSAGAEPSLPEVASHDAGPGSGEPATPGAPTA